MRTYSLAAWVVVIDGNTISGGSDSDFISMTFPDAGEMTTGAGGEKVFSGFTDNGATLMISVLQGSEAYKTLLRLFNAQKALIDGGSPLLPLNVYIHNPLTDEKINSPYAAFTKPPDLKGTKTVSSYEFTLELASAGKGREG